jgi:enoyl-CoA hydratase
MAEATDRREQPHAPPTRPLVELELFGHESHVVALIRLNRPETRNPIDKDTIGELLRVLSDLTLSTRENAPQAIILTGNGSAFSAGGDLKGYETLYRKPNEFRRFMEEFAAVCELLETCGAITVAMINGACIAGGLELALACDVLTMADSARIGDGHLRFAQLPGAGGSQRLVRAIGSSQASKWLLTGSLYDAAVAEALGLAWLTAPADQLLDATLDLMSLLLHGSPLSRKLMKELIQVAESTDLAEGLRQERQIVFDYATTSHDATEGLRVFRERRPAGYLGR